jgi:hypothetical protein
MSTQEKEQDMTDERRFLEAADGSPVPVPRLEYVFSVTLLLANRYRTPRMVSGIERGWISVVGGSIDGPTLSGKVLPVGGDPAEFGERGIVRFDAQYVLQADDGTTIHINNRGLRDASAHLAAGADMAAVIDPDTYDIRTSPVFDVEPGPYEWLTRNTFVGLGRKAHDGNGNRIHYFMVA